MQLYRLGCGLVELEKYSVFEVQERGKCVKIKGTFIDKSSGHSGMKIGITIAINRDIYLTKSVPYCRPYS